MHSSANAELEADIVNLHDPAGHRELSARGPFGQPLYQLSKGFALTGGLLFLALVGMSLVSIVGRKLFAMPVPGDIEMLQMGTAVASATLLPYCEMNRSHLRVDFFTINIRPQARARLDAIAHCLLGLFAAIIAWRTLAATESLYESAETSMMLGWPIWPALAFIVPSFILLTLAGFYNAFQLFNAGNDNGGSK